jgi:hypothetical protein
LEEDGINVPFSELTGTAGHKEKLLRLGLNPIEPRGPHTFRSEENHLPIAQRNSCPGLEMVAISRAMTEGDFAIGIKWK